MAHTLLHSMFMSFPAGLLVLDAKGIILESNLAARSLPGGADSELEGRDFLNAYESLENFQQIRDRFLIDIKEDNLHATFETGLSFTGSDGSTRRLPIHLQLHSFQNDKTGTCILVIMEIVGEYGNRNAAKVMAGCAQRLTHLKHEINNPLMGIFGNAELLAAKKELPEAARKRAGSILEQARNIRDRVIELGELRDEMKGGDS